MISEEHNEKLQLLRTVTKSHAATNTSLVLDAVEYIKDLKKKILNHQKGIASQSLADENPSVPMQVRVETLDKGFLINVASKRSCPGLLASTLKIFQDLGLNILEARVSCTDAFRIEAITEENHEQGGSNMDAEAMEQALIRAMRSCRLDVEQQ